MDWIYDSPLSKTEKDALRVLTKKLGDPKQAERSIKLLSLYVFLKKQKYSTPKELQEHVFFDKEKTKPVFTEETAKQSLRSMKQKGGNVSKYPFTDYMIKNGFSGVSQYLPDLITIPINNVYSFVTTPLSALKENAPLIDLALNALHGVTEITVTTIGDIAEGIGGAPGAVIGSVLTGLMAMAASGIAVLEADFGQAFAHLSNAIPVVGSAIGKGITQMEHGVTDLERHETIAEFVPFVSGYIESKKLPTAGKRFSTRRRKYTKWLKTRRTKSAKV
jgi:hypothetical protein